MMRASTAALVAVLLVSSAALSAQNPAKALTNDDVVKMVAAGLPESTIVQVIQRGPTTFDTSPDALIKLKKQGITAPVMDAMLGVKASGTVTPPSAPTSNVSSSKGVFVQIGNDWKRLEEVSSIEVRSVGGIASNMTLGLKEARIHSRGPMHKNRMKAVPGGRAGLRPRSPGPSSPGSGGSGGRAAKAVELTSGDLRRAVGPCANTGRTRLSGPRGPKIASEKSAEGVVVRRP